MECKAFILSSYTFTTPTHTFGRFRWVDCQLKYLARYFPVELENALNELPATLDETYERTLGEIEDTNWGAAQRLLQCVAVASRPFRLEELADILAFNFNAGPIPTYRMDCRPEDPVGAVLPKCSILLSQVNAENSRVVQFEHSTWKEFLTSTRFSKKCDTISSRYHISMSPAHTVIAQACLGILLHLPENVTKDSLMQYPLAEYAAEHWFEHARFEGVSQNIIEGMIQLFDRAKPHFAIWLWICNPTLPSWKRGETERPSPPHGTPLHYATFCGLRDVVKVLAVSRRYINSRSFNNELTPLHLASCQGHLATAQFLVEHRAKVAAQDKDGLTPLHLASERGHLDLARLLIKHGAGVKAQARHGPAPLHLASKRGHLDLVRLLVEHGANVAAQDQCGSTPLHLASFNGHLDLARFLVEHGANAAAQDHSRSTPLHDASFNGHHNLARFLVEQGVNAAAQDQSGLTPLHQASERGHLNLARFLVEQGANAAAQDQGGWTPLHLGSFNGHLDIARFLVEHGANVAAQDYGGSTPLHLAAFNNHLNLARFLIEHGSDAATQDQGGSTPLHLASQRGHLDVARFLSDHDAATAAETTAQIQQSTTT